MSEIGDRIRELRTRKGFSQRVLADRSGVARNTIVRTERGETVPSSELIVKVAGGLGVDPSSLFEGEESLISIPVVQNWLRGVGHKSEEEFLDWSEALGDDIDDEGIPRGVERGVQENREMRDRILAELRTFDAKNTLFPRAQGLPKDQTISEIMQQARRANALRAEIRHEYLVREVALVNFSKRLYTEGRTAAYLGYETGTRPPSSSPSKSVRRRFMEQAYAEAALG